ncbi:MAG: hypothetical protein QOF78_2473 [Phycisphaerales bacterium]|jgi:hypothetical protein|nr:hypothetical protein [Phycisphaerales bacterium]
MTEVSYRSPGGIGFSDRSSMLLVVGILFIITGALCGCMTAAAPLALFMPRPPGGPEPRVSNVVVGVFVYAVLCAALLTLGIGCVRKRRWVRPLIIVFGWIGLAGGTAAMIVWAATAPQMGNAMRAAAPPGGAAPPAAMINVMVTVMTVFFAFIYVIIPAVLLWLFRGADVQATLEHYDPVTRWTDGVPLPVLGLCAILALGALWALMSAAQGWFFAFGIILTGASGRSVAILVCAAFAIAAWLAFRRRPAGWLMAMMLFIVMPLAWISTLLRHDLMEVYRAMGMSEAELRTLSQIQGMGSWIMIIIALAVTIGAITFTIRVRRYFVPQDLQSSEPPLT